MEARKLISSVGAIKSLLIIVAVAVLYAHCLNITSRSLQPRWEEKMMPTPF